MEETRLRKIGIEKTKKFNNNFDEIYDLYKKKAEEAGYTNELKFIKERGKVIVYVVL